MSSINDWYLNPDPRRDEEYGDRTHLLHQTNVLDESLNNLTQSRTVLNETNEIGANVMSKLLNQRDSILRTKQLINDTQDIQHETRDIIRSIGRSEFYTRMGVERLSCQYDQSLSNRFKTHGEPYSSQYYLRSLSRLESFRKILVKLLIKKWSHLKIGDSKGFSYKFVESMNYVSGKCVIVGTVFKFMKYQPSPLDEYCRNFDLMIHKRTEYTDDEDYLCLEDHTQRLILKGECLDPHKFVSGLVVAVRGYLTEQSKFYVEEYMLPGVPESLSLPKLEDEEKFVGFASGLELSGSELNYKALLLLQNLLLNDRTLKNSDIFYAQLASSINVDLMPGDLDPTNKNLPQQVINPVLMEQSKRYGTFKSTTNPYFFTLNGVRFLGVSGQTVENICKFSRLTELEALKLVAESRCIAPTGTDSLPCHSELDVFNLTEDSEYPHVFFSGNCKEFALAQLETSNDLKLPKLICVPSFKNDPTLVLVSLKTLDVVTIKLS